MSVLNDRLLVDTFMKHVFKGPICWEWLGKPSRKRYGYGAMMFHGVRKLAHQWAYEIFNGPIPEGMCVRHRCDYYMCVTPWHLILGTQADNRADCVARGRVAKGTRIVTAVLDENLVDRIRNLYKTGEYSHLKLANLFDVSKSSVFRLLHGETWK